MSPSSPPRDPPPGDEKEPETNLACKSAETDAKADENSIAESISSEDTTAEEINTDALGRTLTTRISRASEPSLTRRVTSAGTTGTTDPRYEVDWEDETDSENPKNWPLAYRALLVFFLSWNTLVIVLYSTSYTSGVSILAKEFGTSSIVMTLGLTFYLVGLAAGSMVLAPLTEMYGRKLVSLTCLFLFTVMIIPCALSTSIPELIIVRFLSAFFGSVLVSAGPGLVADLVDEEHRALAISIWSVGPMNGPVLGPILGGFVTQYLSWRWMDWIVLILAGVALVFTLIMKETYAPILLKRKAARLRKQTGDTRWWSPYDEKRSLLDALKVNLVRPSVMAVTEPICIFWNLYVGVIYGILYLCFVAYPIVFREIRGWPLGLSGLGFLGIGAGILICIICEPLIRRMINSHKPDPQSGKPPPEAMVSVICICSIIIPIGELWFAWTCSPKSIHWIAPIIAGVFFGAGNTGVFIYASNYLAGSYGVYAASALAGNTVIRSVLGGVMPLAGSPMYKQMGANWAGTLLGLLEVALIPIPFVFWKYGHRIRMKSPIIMKMQEERDRMEKKRERMVQRLTVHASNQGKEPV